MTGALQTDFARRGKSANRCPAPFAKIFRFTSDPNHLYIYRHPVLTRGTYRDRHGRWARDAMDADSALTKALISGRQSRVVLTPRRWRQVGGSNSAGDGGNKARSPGRARNKPLKPLRREGRVFR